MPTKPRLFPLENTQAMILATRTQSKTPGHQPTRHMITQHRKMCQTENQHSTTRQIVISRPTIPQGTTQHWTIQHGSHQPNSETAERPQPGQSASGSTPSSRTRSTPTSAVCTRPCSNRPCGTGRTSPASNLSRGPRSTRTGLSLLSGHAGK